MNQGISTFKAFIFCSKIDVLIHSQEKGFELNLTTQVEMISNEHPQLRW
jgi:hypothetical protein